jgi:SynChlorMet cassette radical SAM/SPASM protein ScmE
MGLCRQNTAQVQLTVDERALAMETLLKLSKKYNGRITANAGPLAEARMWTEMERARREGQESLPGRGYLRSCGGVFSKIAVRADGVIVPCIQMGHMELGQVGEDDLREIWQNHEALNSLRQRQDIHLGDFEFCTGCAYLPYCSGNCPALAYTLLGKENHPSPDACLRRFLAEGGRLPVEESDS